MSLSLKTAASVAVMIALSPAISHAELRSEMSAFVVTTGSDGVEQYQRADSVKPGQLIEYRIKHQNSFESAISGVAIVGPVPEQAIVAAEASTSTIDATFEVRGELDPDQPGEEWSTLPAQRIVVLEDGSRLIEDAKPEHFSAVRWKLITPLQANEVVTNTYRVRVK